MRFALIGDDPRARGLIETILRHPSHRVVAAVGAEFLLDRLPGAAHVLRIADWSSLIDGEDFDSLLVATSEPELLRGARELAAPPRRLFVLPHLDQQATFAYSLLPVIEETGLDARPLFLNRVSPRFERVRELIASGELGFIRMIQWDRQCTSSSAGVFPFRQVEQQLLHDLDSLRSFGGDYEQVTALRSGESAGRCTSQTVTLDGATAAEAVWTFRAGPADRWTFTVFGERQCLTASGEGDADVSELKLGEDPVPLPEEHLSLGWIDGSAPGELPAPSWLDLIRCWDLMEGATRSLRRRRTIDLHFETTSERNQFKTQMTAIGCGLVSLTLFAVVLLLGVGAALDPRDAAQRVSQAANFIIPAEEFVAGAAELAPAGQSHVRQIAAQAEATSPGTLIIVEETDAPLSEARRQSVVDVLEGEGFEEAELRTVVRPIEGRWFETAMLWIWIAAFTPLTLFLLSQLLIVLARPAGVRQTTPPGD